jgi:hypothetical protein
VPGKEERAGAHRNGGSTVRREESFGGCGVLQHQCERGKLGLAQILNGVARRALTGEGEDGGGAR